jgi:hypothetical protein
LSILISNNNITNDCEKKKLVYTGDNEEAMQVDEKLNQNQNN